MNNKSQGFFEGSKFMNYKFRNLCQKNEITQRFSSSYTLERKKIDIMETTRCFINNQTSLKKYSVEACPVVVYTINRLPIELIQGKSLFLTLYNREPDLKYLRVFR